MAEASGSSSSAGFYRQIMSYEEQAAQTPAVRTNIPPPHVEKELEIRKSELARYLKLEVFRVLEIHEDPESQERKFYNKFLRSLTKKELKKLQKTINGIANHFLEDEDEAEEFEQFRHLTSNTINHRLKKSRLLTQELLGKILQRLKSFSSIKIDQQEHEYIIIADEKALDVSTFAQHHFHDIIEDFDNYVKENKVIPTTKGENGHTFVKVCLIQTLIF